MAIKDKILSRATILLLIIGFAIIIWVLASYAANSTDTIKLISYIVLLLVAAGFLLSAVVVALVSLTKLLERVG